VLGPAFIKEGRDLTPEGLTKPGYVGDIRDVGPGRVVAIIPAHNEASRIEEAARTWEWNALVGSPTELPVPPSHDHDR